MRLAVLRVDVAQCGLVIEGALGAIMLDETGAEDFGEFTGGVAAESVHLPEPVLRGDESGEKSEQKRGEDSRTVKHL